MRVKTVAHAKSYNYQIKSMYFLIEGNHLLGKFNIICYKVTADIRKEFDSELVYNKLF